MALGRDGGGIPTGGGAGSDDDEGDDDRDDDSGSSGGSSSSGSSSSPDYGGGTGLRDDTQDTGARGGSDGSDSDGGDDDSSSSGGSSSSGSSSSPDYGGGTGLRDDTQDTGAQGGADDDDDSGSSSGSSSGGSSGSDFTDDTRTVEGSPPEEPDYGGGTGLTDSDQDTGARGETSEPGRPGLRDDTADTGARGGSNVGDASSLPPRDQNPPTTPDGPFERDAGVEPTRPEPASDEAILAAITSNVASRRNRGDASNLTVTGFQESDGEIVPTVSAAEDAAGVNTVPDEFRDSFRQDAVDDTATADTDEASVVITDDGEIPVAFGDSVTERRRRNVAAAEFDAEYPEVDIRPTNLDSTDDGLTLDDETVAAINERRNDSGIQPTFDERQERQAIDEQIESRREQFRQDAAEEFDTPPSNVEITEDDGQLTARPDLTEDQRFLRNLSGEGSALTTALLPAVLAGGALSRGADTLADSLDSGEPVRGTNIGVSGARDITDNTSSDVELPFDLPSFDAGNTTGGSNIGADGASEIAPNSSTDYFDLSDLNLPAPDGPRGSNIGVDGAREVAENASAEDSPIQGLNLPGTNLTRGSNIGVDGARDINASSGGYFDVENVDVPGSGIPRGTNVGASGARDITTNTSDTALLNLETVDGGRAGSVLNDVLSAPVNNLSDSAGALGGTPVSGSSPAEQAFALGAAGVVAPEPSTTVGGAIVAGGAGLALLGGAALGRRNEIETPEEPQSITTELDIDDTAPTTINSELEPGERDVVELPVDEGVSPGGANVEVEVPDDAEFTSSDIVINDDGNLEMPAEATAVSAGLRYEDEEEEEDEDEDEEEEAEVEEEESQIFVEIENIDRGEEYLDEDELAGANEESDTAEQDINQELEELLEDQLYLRPGVRQGQGQQSEEADGDLAVDEEYIPYGSGVEEFTDSEWDASDDLLNDEIFEEQQQREVDSDTIDVLSDTLLEEQSDDLLGSPAGGDSLTGAFGAERDQQDDLSDAAPDQDIFEDVFADDASAADTMTDVFADDASAADTMTDAFSDTQSDTQLDNLLRQNLSTDMSTPAVEAPRMSPINMSPINMEPQLEQYGQSSGGSLPGAGRPWFPSSSSDDDSFDSLTGFDTVDDLFDTGVADPGDALDDLFGGSDRGSNGSPRGFSPGGGGSSDPADGVFGGLL